nr:MAG TPA: hypothetical protein [Caudoviricetes sp.]
MAAHNNERFFMEVDEMRTKIKPASEKAGD